MKISPTQFATQTVSAFLISAFLLNPLYASQQQTKVYSALGRLSNLQTLDQAIASADEVIAIADDNQALIEAEQKTDDELDQTSAKFKRKYDRWYGKLQKRFQKVENIDSEKAEKTAKEAATYIATSGGILGAVLKMKAEISRVKKLSRSMETEAGNAKSGSSFGGTATLNASLAIGSLLAHQMSAEQMSPVLTHIILGLTLVLTFVLFAIGLPVLAILAALTNTIVAVGFILSDEFDYETDGGIMVLTSPHVIVGGLVYLLVALFVG